MTAVSRRKVILPPTHTNMRLLEYFSVFSLNVVRLQKLARNIYNFLMSKKTDREEESRDKTGNVE